MATTMNYAALAPALAAIYRDTTVKTFNARSVLLRVIPKTRMLGKNSTWTWEGTGAIGENYTDGQDVANYGSDDKNVAVLTTGMYRSNFQITDYAASGAANSQSPSDLTDIAANEFINASRKVASTINGAGYAGAGTGTTIAGLSVAVADANTYAGVDRTQAANAGFRSSVFDPGVPTALSIDQIRGDISSIYDSCGETPQLGLMPTNIWNKLASKFSEFRRLNQDVTVGSRIVRMDASVGMLEIDGCIFIKDKDCTASAIYYLNPDYVRWEYLPFPISELQMEMLARTREMQIDDGYGAMPLGMLCKALGETGAAQKMTMQIQLQLVVSKPNSCGKRLNVSPTL